MKPKSFFKNVTVGTELTARFLMVFVPVLALIFFLDLMVYNAARKSEGQGHLTRARQAVSLGDRIILDSLAETASDLKILAAETERLFFRTGLELESREELTHIFGLFCDKRRMYDQIRFLDDSGLERIRVNLAGDGCEVVPADLLQDKGDRYYFTDAFGLDRGQVYVSPLDLNIERGRIEQPLKPLIRLGTVVFDAEGRKRGLVLLNYLADHFLTALRRSVRDSSTRLFLVNSDGYWLIGPQPEDEWGFMFEDRGDRTITSRWPDFWEMARNKPSGHMVSDAGLFTFTTIRPAALIMDPPQGQPDRNPNPDQRTWTLISMVDNEDLRAESRATLRRMLIGNAVFLILVLAALIIDARLRLNRIRTEAELRKLYRAVEQSPVTVVITDPEGRIEYVNPKFVETTGYSAEEALGQNPSILKSGRQPPEVYENLWRNIKQGKEWRGELQNKTKAGELYWEYVSISPIKDESGRTVHYLAIKEDVTERKAAEEHLRRADEAAQAADQAKSRFLANMSHEIRTPMSGVLGLIDIMLQDELTAEQQERLGVLRQSAQALMTLLDGVLDLSRMDAERLKLEERSFALAPVVEKAAAEFAPAAKAKGLSLETSISGDLPEHFFGDPKRLSQVLHCLLDNAVKFSDQGRIDLKVEARSRSEDRIHLFFQVADTGPGIPTEIQRHIFSPFTQADGGSTRSHGGAGLGLALAGGLVELMGGRLWLESQVGRGSIFYFTIDLGADPDGTTGAEPGDETGPGKRIQALLASGDPERLPEISRSLEQAGLLVDTADSGEQILKLTELTVFDVILLDAGSAGDDFLEAVGGIRRREGGDERGRLPVFIAAPPGAEDWTAPPDLDIDGVLPPNFDAFHLMQELQDQAPGQVLIGDGPIMVGPEKAPVVDRRKLIERVGGDMELLRDMVEIFISGLSPALAAIAACLEKDADREGLPDQVLKLKGTVSMFGSRSVTNLLQRLEEAVKRKDLSAAAAVFKSLTRELDRLQEALEDILSDEAQS